ncbi:MAG: 5'-methylthioadenosine/S-adenosylhomocysteine nucleosidase [Symploca sp. SIO3E6]|nr:5'-methylthioadenosine/S-adenosylhomocysteine nucleosidase [Caldora sp. SIO3E6]
MSESEIGDHLSNLPLAQNSRFLISKANNRFFVEVCSDNKTSVPVTPYSNFKRTNRQSRPKYNSVDVLIITAADGEQEALLKCRDGKDDQEPWKQKQDNYKLNYWEHSFTCENGKSFKVATADARKMGEKATREAAFRLVSQLRPSQCLAMVGICAGWQEAVNLGDVLVAEQVFKIDSELLRAVYNEQSLPKDVYKNIKPYDLDFVWSDQVKLYHKRYINDWTDTIKVEKPKSYEYQKYWLLERIYEHQENSIKYPDPEKHEDLDKECPKSGQVIEYLKKEGLIEDEITLTLTDKGKKEVKKSLRRGSRIQELRKQEKEESRVVLCPIGTVDKVQENEQIFDDVNKHVRGTYGIEMEAYAIGETAREYGIKRWIVAKAVSDYADKHRGRNKHFREYACQASASFLIAFLKKYLYV